MNLPQILQPNTSPTRVWDLDVPIIQNRTHTDAYILDGIDEPAIYNELCHLLRVAERGDTFTLHLNTPGGLIDSAFMIVDAIKASKAKVTAYLTGTVASAGTLITMACDAVVVADHTSFMIHNYSGGLGGKGHEMKARQEFVDRSLNNAFVAFYTGFLTEQEMKDVIDGKDMWMGKDEVLTRWSYKTGRTSREEA